jgi:hypothetical protein
MHGSLHLTLANESARVRVAEGNHARRAASFRRPLAKLVERVARAHGIPPRAHPEPAASPPRPVTTVPVQPRPRPFPAASASALSGPRR